MTDRLRDGSRLAERPEPAGWSRGGILYWSSTTKWTCSRACATSFTAPTACSRRSRAQQAIEILERDDVELILTDQRMPGMSGDQFLREARRLKPDAIRMLFTGYADIQAVINAVNEGHIFRYILKPWDTVELEGIIRQGVEQYDLLAERKRLVAELQAANVELVAGQRRARPGRPAQDGLHRGGEPRVQHADHPGPGPDRAACACANPTRSDQEQEILRQITSSGRQLARLVTNMLTLLRAEDFRRTLERSPVDLADVDPAGRRSGPAVHPRPPAPAPDRAWPMTWAHFEIDADKISAVLINLLTNAIKFTPDGGTIELAARLTERRRGGDSGRRSRRRSGAAGTRGTCSSRSSRSSIPAAIPRAISASASEGWGSA